MTFYFYDLETSGFRAKQDRIMQFAGQRTDIAFKPIGKPDNVLIKMTPDVLPEPGAVLVHGITPQRTLKEGITEAEFAKYLTSQVFTPDTIIIGYNNIRFDNDFIRFTLWRNFYDPYEWSWKDNCSTWDLIDVGRMTRALRPDGIEWPFAPNGKPTNSLEYMTAVNKLDHIDAHDAMSDVNATIALAKLFKQKQPELFEYLFNLRGKDKVAPLITKSEPVVYTSGKYPSEYSKTTIAVMVAEKPDKSGALMYDLRIDPGEFKNMSPAELVERWRAWGDDVLYFPVKELRYNRCPAVAPLSRLDQAGYERLELHQELIDDHLAELRQAKDFANKLLEAQGLMWPKHQPQLIADEQTVDSQLYEDFVPNIDKPKMSVLRAAKPQELSKLSLDFQDERLNALLPLYKARNFPEVLGSGEKSHWESFRRTKLASGGNASLVNRFYSQLDELARTPGVNSEKQHLLADLEAYAKWVLQGISTSAAVPS